MSSETPGPKINYSGNSKLDKEIAAETAEATVKTEPKLKKFEGISVTQTKPTLGKRFRESFGGQNLKVVAAAVLVEVIVPNAKDLLMAVIKEGAHRSIYGEGARKTGSSIGSSIVGSVTRARTTNYSNISTQSRVVGGSGGGTLSSRERTQFDFSHLLFADRAEAEDVIEQMSNAIDEFGMVTVADFYDAIQQTGTGFTDQKFGWDARAFAGAKVKVVSDGYVLLLPPPLEVQ